MFQKTPKHLIAISCLTITILLVGCGQSSDQTANKFMRYIKNGKHLQIQESLSKQTYQMMIAFYGSISDKKLKPYYRTGQVSSFQLKKIAETNKSCRYQVTIKTKSGKLYKDTIDLVKEDNEWKVSHF